MNYGRHTGDEDVKIYYGKAKTSQSREAKPQRNRPAAGNFKRREPNVRQPLSFKDAFVPAASAAVLLLAWLLPTGGWLRVLSFGAAYVLAGFDVVLNGLEKAWGKNFLSPEFIMIAASLAAFCIGEYIAATIILLLFRLLCMLEAFIREKSRKAFASATDIRPESANVETAEGLLGVEPDYVNVGDVVLVSPGERVPLDGTVIEGVSAIDCSPLTGESEAVAVTVGHRVLSGCVNISSPLRLRVACSYTDSTVNKLLDLVESAGKHQSRQEAAIRRFSKIYTPLMLLLSLALAIVPPLFNGQWLEYIRRAVVLMLASCPGPLLEAVSLAYFSGVCCAFKNGIIVKGYDILETMAATDTMVFDKTGTITEGRFTITDVFPEEISEHELLSIAATAECCSKHPIAQALRAASGSLTLAEGQQLSAEEIPGRGVIANLDGKQILVGNAALLVENGIGYKVPGRSGAAIHVAMDKVYLGHILISDRIKRGAFDALESLRVQGVKKTVMLTGDVLSVARPIASKLNFDMIRAELLPEEKASALAYLIKSKGGIGSVAFVGDGVNDALVMAGADLSIALGAVNSEGAIESADVVIMDDQIARLPMLASLSHYTVRSTRISIILSLLVKLFIILMGSFGVIPIFVAALCDTVVFAVIELISLTPLKAWKEEKI